MRTGIRVFIVTISLINNLFFVSQCFAHEKGDDMGETSNMATRTLASDTTQDKDAKTETTQNAQSNDDDNTELHRAGKDGRSGY